MKKIYLALLCATALTCGAHLAYAQEDNTMPPPPPHHSDQDIKQHHEKMKNKLADELKLTDEQKAKAKELRKASREKIKPLMDEMKEIRKKMDAIREDNMKAFEDLLTPEQKEAFEKIKEERKAKHEKMMKKHHHHPMPPMPME